MAASAANMTNAAMLGSSQSQVWGKPQQQHQAPGTPARAGFLLSQHRYTIARASSKSESESQSGPGETARKEVVQSSSGSGSGLERRQLLVATAAGLAAASASRLDGSPATAAPISAPDLALCKLSTYTEGGPAAVNPTPREVQCCPPFGSDVKVVDFVLPPQTGPLRVRKAAHKLTDAEKATYERAYAKIKALPADHPHSLQAQANVHCAYCNYGYFQQDGKTPLQVHDSWLFLPFHRWYLYFHERILAKYAGDPNFALPFWNWDNQDPNERPVPNEIPGVFLDARYPTLKNAIRNTTHFPPNIVDFTRGKVPQSEPQRLRDCNTALLYQNLVDSARKTSLFFGGAYRAGDALTPGGGTLESLPHGPPHGWTGGPATDPKSPAGEDMGNFYSAGRDPIFYSHHSNVDRMWSVWNTLPGYKGRPGRRDPDDPDWLNSSFLFYDENLQLVRVYVRDTLSTEKLRYKFADAPDAWKDYQLPKVTAPPGGRRGRRRGIEIGDFGGPPGRGGPGGPGGPPGRGGPGGPPGRGGPGGPGGPGGRGGPGRFQLEDTKGGSTFKLGRPDRPRRRGERRDGKRSPQPVPRGDDDEDEEEILVLEGVVVPINKTISFDVFLDLDEGITDPDACLPNYVGSYYNVAHTAPGGKTERTTNLRLGIGNKLKQLGITDTDDLEITLVARDKDKDAEGKTAAPRFINVTNFSIEYE